MGYHYVPQQYLRGFCVENSDSQIVAYDKKERRFFQTHVKNVAQEGGFYDDETEHQLATCVEDPAKPAIDSLRAGSRNLDLQDRRHLAFYAAVMLKRVPHSRARARGTLPETVRAVVGRARSQLAEHLNRDEGKADVIAQHLKKIEGLEDKMIDNPPANLLEQINSPWPTVVMVKAIFEMKWRIVGSEGPQYFITTDNPGFFFSAYGLRSPKSEFVLPLSTNVALVGNWSATAPLFAFIGPIRQPLVRELNRRLISEATRFIFASREEEWMRKLSAKNHHYLSRIEWR